MTDDVLPALLAGAAGWLAAGPSLGGVARLRRLERGAGPAHPRRARALPAALAAALARPAVLVRMPGAAAVTAGALLVLGRPGPAVPLLVAGVALGVPARRRLAAARRARVALARQVPRAADLMATCLDAGAAPVDAVEVVTEHLAGPVRAALRPVVAALRAGADPAAAWALLPGDRTDPAQRLSRAFVRAAATGAPLSRSLCAVADDQRAALRWHAEAAARRAGVRAVAPLGLCFLPAFLLLGVVPVVVGVAAQVLGGLR